MSTAVPPRVAALAGPDAVEPVWQNELGGLTFRVLGADGTRYIKWQPTAGLTRCQLADVNLVVEAEKLRWAARFTPVPRVLGTGAHGRAGAQCLWLVTEGIDAVPAVDPRWHGRPETAVRAIATGLRRLHDSVPVENCPFNGTWLGDRRPFEIEARDLVVCHGDPCVPNTLLSAAGDFAAHVDLARLGVGDRWSDLAIATYSIGWDVNFGRSYDGLFFSTYGIEPDCERIRAYRALWDEEEAP